MLSSVQSNDPLQILCMVNLSHSYKWTIPVQWNSLHTNNKDTVLFDKDQTGTSTEPCLLNQVNLINIIIYISKSHTWSLSTCQKNNSCVIFLSEVIIEKYSPAADGLIKVNNDHMGFYRVNHPEDIWAAISQQLLTDHLVLSPVFIPHLMFIAVIMCIHKGLNCLCLFLWLYCRSLVQQTEAVILMMYSLQQGIFIQKKKKKNLTLYTLYLSIVYFFFLYLCTWMVICIVLILMYFHRADVIINYSTTFELLNYLAKEKEYIVWDRVASSIAYVKDMLASDSTLYSKFQVSLSRI